MKTVNSKIGAVCSRKLFSKLCGKLMAHGISPRHVINMEIVKYDLSAEDISGFDWIVFTSPNGVGIFFELYGAYDISGKTKFAVLGKGTGDELRKIGFEPAFCPDTYTVEELAKGLSDSIGTGENALVFRSARGNPVLTNYFAQNNIEFKEVKCYDTVGRFARECDVNQYEYLLFFSASGANAFKEIMPSVLIPKCICIGYETEMALRRIGIIALRVAKVHDVDGMVSEVLECLNLRDSDGSGKVSL